MDKAIIGSTLKQARMNSGLSVEEVSSFLTQKGYKALEKTVYSWESGNSQPKPDILLELCRLYGIKDVLKTFGFSEESEPLTVAAHFEGDDFTEEELADIQSYAEFVRNRRKKLK